MQSSDVLVAQMEAIGGSPQKMAFSEVYGALQQGVVDGQENTWSNIYGKKFFEVQDGVTETNHGALDYLVVTSVDWLDSLEPEVRDQFLTILGEVTATRNAESTKVNGEARQAIIDAGGVVRELTPEQRAAWVDAMKPVWDKFAGDVGQDMIDAAQAINAGSVSPQGQMKSGAGAMMRPPQPIGGGSAPISSFQTCRGEKDGGGKTWPERLYP